MQSPQFQGGHPEISADISAPDQMWNMGTASPPLSD